VIDFGLNSPAVLSSCSVKAKIHYTGFPAASPQRQRTGMLGVKSSVRQRFATKKKKKSTTSSLRCFRACYVLIKDLSICVWHCRQLECERVTIHKHLFLSYILNGLCWILYYSIVPLNTSVMRRNPVSWIILHLYSSETVAKNEKKEENARKQSTCIYKISRSDITHSGDYG